MRIALMVVVVAVISCLFMSCGQKEPDMAALKKTVDDFNAAEKDALMGGNSDNLLAFFADDAMEMPPNMAMMKGKDAIKAFWDQSMKSGMKMSAVEFSPIDMQAGGTIAYEVGSYDMTVSAGKMGETKDKGKYIALWKQQSDGTWKVAAETWNTDMPMPAVEKSTGKKANSKHKVMSKKASSKKTAVSKKPATKKKATAKKSKKSTPKKK